MQSVHSHGMLCMMNIGMLPAAYQCGIARLPLVAYQCETAERDRRLAIRQTTDTTLSRGALSPQACRSMLGLRALIPAREWVIYETNSNNNKVNANTFGSSVRIEKKNCCSALHDP